MRTGLQALNDGLPRNPMVTITGKAGGWIHLTPLDAQPEASNVTSLKAELGLTWPMTSLLDILKKTDLRLNFSDALRSVTSYENLERAVLRPRLLLCLHGIGTNTGLQRMNAAQHGATYRDLAYVRRRYITVENLCRWAADTSSSRAPRPARRRSAGLVPCRAALRESDAAQCPTSAAGEGYADVRPANLRRRSGDERKRRFSMDPADTGVQPYAAAT